MGQIETIIDKSYTDIAEYIYFPYYTGDENKEYKKKAFNYHIGVDKKTPQSLFYEMLDIIIDTISDSSNSINSAEYYKDLNIFSDGLLDASSIEKTQFDLDSKLSRIKKRLYKTVPIKRIAELVYYKICHKRYSRRLELAFRGVVQGIASQYGTIGSIINTKTAETVRNVTRYITKSQVDSFYTRVFVESGIQDKYIISREKYLNADFAFFYTDEEADAQNVDDIKSDIQKYKETINVICRETTFITFDKCFENYRGNYKMSRITHRDCFKKVLTALAGYTFDERFAEKYHVSDYFILNSMCEDINALIEFFCMRFNGVKDCMKYIQKTDTKSRFTYINCVRDFEQIGFLINLYKQLLTALAASYGEEYSDEGIYLPEEANFLQSRYE